MTIQINRFVPEVLTIGDRIHVVPDNETYTVSLIEPDGSYCVLVYFEDTEVTFGFESSTLVSDNYILLREVNI